MAESEQSIQKELQLLTNLSVQNTESIKYLKEFTSDHEKRIRFLERVIGYGIGILGAIKFLADVIQIK